MRRLAVLLALCLLLREALSALSGGTAAPGGPEEQRPALFLREDLDAAHALALAEKLEKAESWKEAAAQYRKILEGDPEILVPVDAGGAVAPEGSDRYAGARARALARLAAWPAEGRHVLSAQDDLAARPLWERAGMDPAALKALADRHPFSAVGARAMNRLGDVLMESGDPAGAAAAWQALLALRPDAGSLAAAARAKRDAALSLLDRGDAEPAAWQAPPASAPARPGLPLWTFLVDPRSEKARKAYARHGLVQPQPCHPLVSGSLVLLSTPRGLTALDSATGRVRWTSGDPAGSARSASSGPFAAAVSADLCLAVTDGRLAAFERSGGRKRWETPPSIRVVTLPALDRGMAYVGLVETSGPSVAFTAAALRVDDGRFLWRRHVTSSFDRTPLGEGMRGAALVQDGLAVFSTDLGCLMALDALDGSPRWLTRYDPMKEAERRAAARSDRRWKPAPLLASEGRLVAAPRDSAFLLCLDLHDGALGWREPRRDSTDLLAAASGRALLSGPAGARALSLTDRSPLWETALKVRGRGCLASDGLALPCADGPAVLDPATGRILHQDLWPDETQRGGNLLVSKGLVLSCSAERLVAFEPGAACRARLEATSSPEAWLGLGRLALQEGDPSGAQEAFSRASGAPGAAWAEAMEGVAWRNALRAQSRRDWPAAAEAFALAAERSPAADRRLRSRTRAAEAWRLAGDLPKAIGACQRLLADRAEGVVAWRHGSMRADAWARLAVEEMLETPQGRAAYAPVEAEARFALSQVLPGSEETALPEILARYPHSRAAALSALALGRLYAERHIAPLAARFLALASRHGEGPEAAEALRLLAALGPSARDPSAPLPALAWRMRRGTSALPPPRTGLPLMAFGEREGLMALDAQTGARLWAVPLAPAQSPVWAGDVLVAAGEEGGRNLAEGLDAAGRRLWQHPLNTRNAPLWVVPSGVLLEQPEGIFLLSAGTGKILGRSALPTLLAAAPVAAGERILAVTGPAGTAGARAHWLDAKTLRLLAVRDLGPGGVEGLAPCPSAGCVLALLGNRRVLALPLDPGKDGAPRWEWTSETPVLGALAAGESRAVVMPLAGTEEPALRGLDLASGKILWETPLGDAAPWDARVLGDRLVAAVSRGGASGVSAWDLESGRLSWRTDLWGDSGQGACLPLPSGLLAWTAEHEEARLLDPTTGRVLKRYEDLGDAAEQVLPLGEGFLWVGNRAMAACLPLDELERLRPLWRLRDRVLSEERPEEALAEADACFRAGAYADALDALAVAGANPDGPFEPEYASRAGPWREVRALLQPDSLEAPRFRSPPEIDGDLRDGWAEHLCRPLKAPLDLRRFKDGKGTNGTWEGEADLEARVYVGWDERNFYFAVDVDDHKQVIYDENNPWKGDLLIFMIDAEGEGRDLFDGGVAIQNPRAKPPDPASLPAGDYAARRRADDSGTTYEAAVPWSALRKGPVSGEILLKMNISVMDDDGEGIRKSVVLAPGLPANRWDDWGEEPDVVSSQFFMRVKLDE